MKAIALAFLLASSAVSVSHHVASAIELCPVKASSHSLATPETTLTGCVVDQSELLITAEPSAPIRSLSFSNAVILAATKIDLSPQSAFAMSFAGVRFAPSSESKWAVHLRGVYPQNSSISFSRCEFTLVVDAEYTTSPYYSIRSSVEMDLFSAFTVSSNFFNLSSTADETNADVRAMSHYGSTKVTNIHITNNNVLCDAKSTGGVCELLGIYDGQFGSEIIIKDNVCENVGNGYGYGFYSEFDEPLMMEVRPAPATSSDTSKRVKWERLVQNRRRNALRTPREGGMVQSIKSSSLADKEQLRDRLLGRSSYVIDGNTFRNFETSIYVNDGYAKTFEMRRNIIKSTKYNQLILRFYKTTLPMFVNIEDNTITSVLRNELTLNFPSLLANSSVTIDRNVIGTGAVPTELPVAPLMISTYEYENIGYLTINEGSIFSLSDNVMIGSSSAFHVADPSAAFAAIGYQIRDERREGKIAFCNNQLFGKKLDTDDLINTAIIKRKDAVPLVTAAQCPKRSAPVLPIENEAGNTDNNAMVRLR